jgi:hypothetical protein
MTARNQVVATLAQLVTDDIDVKPYAEEIARPPVPTVMVRVDTVRPTPEARHTHRDYGITLILLPTSEDTSGPADDELDDFLDKGAGAEMLPRWSTATRGVYQETVPAYEIACTITAEKQPLTPQEGP